ncbi:MAG TPA: succinyl-diaminopimelate desuccinylase [Acidimicrobiia bacterium]|nr:succinyl-diaminopimelate desuccinylase [Acidimicrobiia bacterium]
MSILETLVWLVDTPSELGNEAAICSSIVDRLSARYDGDSVVRLGNSVVIGRSTGKPLVLLVGHIDTVPAQGQPPAFVRDGMLYGLGTSDMKSGLAVMVHLLEDPEVTNGPFDVVGVFYDGEEGPAVGNHLEQVLQAIPWLRGAEFGVVMEPTDLRIEIGCNGAINATVRFIGKSAHSARPWLGENAITKAGAWLAELHGRPPELFDIDGLEYREVFSVTKASGGIANNILPPSFSLNLNYRFPPVFSVEEAVGRLRLLALAADEVEIVDRAPAAPVPEDNRYLDRLIEVTRAERAAKQGWTDVARLAEYGVPAVNYGPGIVAQAHQVSEHVPIANLTVAFENLKRFLTQNLGTGT